MTFQNSLTPTITLNNLGKKFNREWIFRGLTYEIPPGQKLLVSGGNGSGKSTLLQVISGFVNPNEGEVGYSLHDSKATIPKKIEADTVRNFISFASPYLQLIEDFTLAETIAHIAPFKPFVKGLNTDQVMAALQLEAARNKLIKQFSSGMKQRLKLGLAILSDTPVLLLDEPISNLDKNAIAWYGKMISAHTQNRTVIVCSNAIADEHFFCTAELNVADFKQVQRSL